MTLRLCSIAAAFALAFATSAQAQQTRDPATPKADRPATEKKASSDRKVKDAEEERIEADYKAAKAKCDAMKGAQEDVCEKEAKAKEKVAKADIKKQYAARKDDGGSKERSAGAGSTK
jgi:hypothetical protein